MKNKSLNCLSAKSTFVTYEVIMELSRKGMSLNCLSAKSTFVTYTESSVITDHTVSIAFRLNQRL